MSVICFVTLSQSSERSEEAAKGLQDSSVTEPVLSNMRFFPFTSFKGQNDGKRRAPSEWHQGERFGGK